MARGIIFALAVGALAISATARAAAQDDGRIFTSASSNNFPPVNLLDDNGKLAGFGRDLAGAVIEATGGKIRHIHSPVWTEVLDMLAQGRADFIHDTGYTPDRTTFLDFSEPILQMPEEIFVLRDRYDINSLESLFGKRVACVNKHITHLYLQKIPEIRCLVVKTPPEGVKALVTGVVDAFVYPRQIVLHNAYRSKIAGKIKAVGEPLRTLTWHMAVKKGNADMLVRLNRGIAKVKASGEYSRIYDKWFGRPVPMGPDTGKILYILGAGLGIVAALAIVFGLWTWTLRRTVAARTRDLRRSEAGLESAQRIAHVGSWERDLASDSVTLSAEACRILDIEAEVFPGTYEALTDLMDAEDRDDMRRAVERAVSTGKPVENVARVRLQDGPRKVLFQRIEKQPGGASDTGLIVGSMQDVTDRERIATALDDTLRALEETESRFRSLAASSPAGIWQIGCDGKTLYANQAMCRMLQIDDPEEITDGAIDRFFTPDGIGRIEMARENAVTGGASEAYEIDLIGAEGRHCTVVMADAPLFAPDGTLESTIATIIDVTERRHAEEALAAREKYWRALIEGAQDIITLMDADGTIRYESPAIERLVGYTPDELEGRNAFELIHPDDLPRVQEAVGSILPTPGAREQVEFRFRRKDGTWCSLESIGQNLLHDPAVRAVIVNSRDITDREAVEEQLRQAQKMEAVGKLTGGIAHDFNNLLAIIVGNLDLLSERLKDHGEAGQLIERGIRAAQRGADLTQNLLAFSRKQALRPEIIDPRNLLSGVTNLLRRTLGEDVEIELVCDAGIWVCEADRTQMENAIVNLAINARDAMPQGGKLTLEASNARLNDQYAATQVGVEPGQYVMISVTDTGTGMSDEVTERAFEPFFTTKATGEGTGLGLSMVYGFVKQSGGHVSVYSEVGEGTTFRLYLPRSKGEEIAQTDQATKGLPLANGESILVVEDDPEVLVLVVALLHSLGYLVCEAHNGSEALKELAENETIALLLTDVVLPGGMNGRELVETCRETRPDIKVLYMSGYTENAITHHGRLDEGVRLIQKPFGKADIAVAVRKALDDEPA